MTPASLCYDGSSARPPRRRLLRAGPLSVEYGEGELRYVRLGEREVIRRLCVAVRDPDWGTVPSRVAREEVEAGPDSFRVRFDVEHSAGAIDFAWQGSIDGDADGTIRFAMDGRARATFRRNRVGFCVLHPIDECVGARVRYRQGDGTDRESAFPGFIAPSNPFHDLNRFAHEVEPGTWAELEFEGDLFEMEDQRNWIDASFKTFCTPLRLPFPVTVEAGQPVRQSVTLRLKGPIDAAAIGATTAAPEVDVLDQVVGPLPAIGLGWTTDTPLGPREVDRLRVLRPAHLRVELALADPDYPDVLARAIADADAIGSALEAALTVTDRADAELADLISRLGELRPRVARWLLFHTEEWATSPGWMRLAKDRLGSYDSTIPLFSGTTANFAELNRKRPPADVPDGLCYSIQPQEHASDNASLVETCAAVRDTLQACRWFSGFRPVAVTPITLRKRVNPYATGPTSAESPELLPSRVDPRQMSLLGAGWTLGCLKSLAWGGATSTTWYETAGWLGVLESSAGCPRPALFPSRPGMVYPLYHVLADANERPDARVVLSTSSRPLACDGLSLRSGGALRVLIANLTDEPLSVSVAGLGALARVRLLDETTFARATEEPEAFRADPGVSCETTAGRLDLDLRPFAYARIDTA